MLQRVTRCDLSFALALIFAAGPRRPRADYARVRAKSLAKPKRYDPLSRDAEIDLIRRWWGDGDLDALDQLVGVHRPMAVRMARRWARGNRRLLHIFVEYGIMGIQIAADPPRPSLTKKGALVGFDPAKGRFSTHARQHVDKLIRTAMSWWMAPAHMVDTKREFEEWAKTPIPAHIEEMAMSRPREDSDQSFAQEMTAVNFGEHERHHHWRDEQPHKRRINPTKRFEEIKRLRGMFGIASVLDYDDERDEQVVFLAAGTPLGVVGPWHEQPEPRSKQDLKRKTRPTEAEYAAKDQYYAGYWGKLTTFESNMSKGEDDGWADNEDPYSWNENGCLDLADVWRPATEALQPDQYTLPKGTLELRLKLAVLKDRAALSNEIDWKGLALFKVFGLYNKHGTCHIWPVYSLSREKIVQKKRRNTPFLCRYPISSIYLVGAAIRTYMLFLAAVIDFTPREIPDERAPQDTACLVTDCPEFT
jgi:hypothetical protein